MNKVAPCLVLCAAIFVLARGSSGYQTRERREPQSDRTLTTRTNRQDGLEYVRIPAGTFRMGCSADDADCRDHEKPAHTVTITTPFWLGATEVTVGGYRRFAVATGRPMPGEPVTETGLHLNAEWRDEHQPMVQITWDDSEAYCAWAGGRLPTEAQWEYAARAGTDGSRYGDLVEIAWYADTSGRAVLDSRRLMAERALGRAFHENRNSLHDVGEKKPNAFGLYDTIGNAWEWVADWYDENYYRYSPSQDPSGPPSGQTRVLRGGAWNSPTYHVRVSDRIVWAPGTANIVFGCRCVWDGPPAAGF